MPDTGSHIKRKFSELVKATDIPGLDGTVAAQGVKQISALVHLDGQYGESKDKDRISYRQREVAPKIDDYFALVKNLFKRFLPKATPTRHCNTVLIRKIISGSF